MPLIIYFYQKYGCPSLESNQETRTTFSGIYAARKIGLTQIYLVQISCAKKCKLGGIKSKDGKYHICLPVYIPGVVNLRSNAVFTIFALYLTLICTVLHQIPTEYIWCKSNFSCMHLSLGPCLMFINTVIQYSLSSIASVSRSYTALKIKKICFSPKVSIQPCRPKSDSALPGAI